MSDHAHPAASSGDVLVVEDLVVTTRVRQPAPILDGISLRVGAGETVCLVGESGSGKSVTSLATMGLLPKGALAARSGRILVEGEDVLTASPARLRQLRATRMSMIFQEPMTALNPVMTVESQLEEVLSAHASMSTADRRTRIRDILSLVHLPDVERMCRSYPHQLSGGQRQRVMIAMALV
ncbi:MAG: ATP-binding cassette domain-containing protein, partial [Aurantimonas coralicida]|nr:ATP-binding cassette domain-containing protein [Aurantimonas coralicida]